MTDQEKNIAEWSDKILQFLLDKRKDNPDLKFWLRRRDTKERLSKGLWFQGSDNYICIGFSKRTGGNLSTRSLGFIVWFDENNNPFSFIELIFRNEKDQNVLDVYQSILKSIDGFEKIRDDNYKMHYKSTDVFENFNTFLDKHLPIINTIVKEKGLEEKLIQSDDDFNKSLKNILTKRQELLSKPKNSTLKQLIDSFEKWYINDDHGNNIDFYKETITFSHLNKLNRNEFIDFFFKFAVDGGKIQSGGHRTAPKLKNTLENNYEGLRDFLLEPFDNSFSVESWLGRIENYKGLGSGIATIYLNRINKNQYCIVNNKSVDGFKKIGYTFNTKLIDQYNQIQTASKDLITEYPQLQNFYKTDALTHFIMAVDEGIKIVNELFNNINPPVIMNNIPLNQILFGPPGTGKTYNTINEALKIAAPVFYKKNKDDRKELTKKYRELLIKDWENSKGQIAFCTFHQSFTYEDFVEGIKPQPTDDKSIYYDVDDGVFKHICRFSEDQAKAQSLKTNRLITWNESDLDQAVFYKISLGDIHNPDDNGIYDHCIKNNYISIGFGGGIDFSNLSETEIRNKCKDNNLPDFDAQALNYFIKYLKIGNYIIVSKGNRYVRAMGKVTGEYEYLAESEIRHNNFRKVEWLFVDENIPVEEVYNRNLSQMTIYKLDDKEINKNFFVKEQAFIKSEEEGTNDKNYVLIIDEINRGNVSSIFGELITLIEKDKRAGEDEELEVSLPYSKETFKVPKNVYIIGTMNTADRSIEALDTALRRRFSFKEMPPKSNLIMDKGITPNKDGIVEGIDLVKLLDRINERIEKLLDKDHKIGHSYFMTVDSLKSLESAFKDKVIPLLEEYFYGDLGKIGLVLGSAFVEVEKGEDNGFSFAKFDGYDADVASDLKARKVYKITLSDKWDFKNIYDLSKE